MKRFIIGTAICLLCLSCGRNSFEINGTTTEPDGTEIYLIDLRDSDTLGVTTVEGNTFAFSWPFSIISSLVMAFRIRTDV